MITRTLRAPDPFDLDRTLAPIKRGPTDPSTRAFPGCFWRATRTPSGPATACYSRDGDDVRVDAWGPGGGWILEHAPSLLGFDDDPSVFVAHHDVLARVHRRLGGVRQGRTGAVVEALLPSILEQKITSRDAWTSYAAMVRRLGDPAPGPMPLVVPPEPERLAAVPYFRYHAFGIERRKAEVIRDVCARASRIEECTAMSMDDAYRRLTAFQGIGWWTAAEVARVALGDRDSVSVGDYHLPRLVALVLAGEDDGDDARMLELLEPYAGQRTRAICYVEGSGIGFERRGPRMPSRNIGAI